MASFGTIHDLADIEIRVRRVLLEALHHVNCARRMVIDEALLNESQHHTVAEMLLLAENSIKRVIGD